MERIWMFIGLAVVCVAALWFFLGSRGAEQIMPQNDTIVAFGDSLVSGVGATNGNDFVSQTAQTFGRPIVNMGRAGDTTRDGLARLDTVIAQEPGVVILLLGGNDYLRQIPPEETEQNLAAIIVRLQQEGSIVVLLGVRGGLFRDNFADMYERLADTYNTLYVSDVLNGLFGNSQYMSDTIHPNNAGYAIIAERVSEVLEERIEWN